MIFLNLILHRQPTPGVRVRLHPPGCFQLADIDALSALTALLELNLRECMSIIDIDPLSALRSLRWLGLSSCTWVEDLQPLSACTDLLHLELLNCHSVADLTPLTACSSLTMLDLGQRGDDEEVVGLEAVHAACPRLMVCTGVSLF